MFCSVLVLDDAVKLCGAIYCLCVVVRTMSDCSRFDVASNGSFANKNTNKQKNLPKLSYIIMQNESRKHRNKIKDDFCGFGF